MVARVSPKNKAVLDLCCGQGTLTKMLSESGANVDGIDFSQEMLELAKVAAPHASLQHGDAAALPYSDGSFDAVLCNFGMMHLPDQPKALTEIRRVLRPTGQFLMATWAAPAVSPAFGTVFGAIKAHADFSLAPEQPDLFAFAEAEKAQELLVTAGLRVVAHETVTPVWVLSKPEELYDIFLTATVGASMLIEAQKPEVITAIGDQITKAVSEKFADGDMYRVPVPVVVITASLA